MNIISLRFMPPRNPHANLTPTARELMKQLNLAQLNYKSNKNDLLFSKEITQIFYNGIKHYWVINKRSQLGFPIWGNWLFWIGLHLYSHSLLSSYEYFNYAKALSRGVGLCSQHALAVTDYMHRVLHLRSYAIGLDGHVINETIFAHHKAFVLDADYNVVLPFSLTFAQNHPKITHSFYRGKATKKNIEISHIYTKKNAKLYTSGGVKIYKYCYVLGWVVSFVSFLIAMMLLRLLIMNRDHCSKTN